MWLALWIIHDDSQSNFRSSCFSTPIRFSPAALRGAATVSGAFMGIPHLVRATQCISKASMNQTFYQEENPAGVCAAMPGLPRFDPDRFRSTLRPRRPRVAVPWAQVKRTRKQRIKHEIQSNLGGLSSRHAVDAADVVRRRM